MRKKWSIILAGFLICQSMGALQAQTIIMDGRQIEYSLPAISLYVNGGKVETKVMSPVELKSRVLVPAREVFEAMGALVGWDNTLKKITIQYKSQTIILTINETEALINQSPVTLDVPGKIINDKVMIPIRFVSEAMGMTVKWDAASRSVSIDEKKSEASNSNEQSQKADVYRVTSGENNNQFEASILAYSAMGQVKVASDIGKVILDIPNSRSSLSSSILVDENTYVERIRTSQFTEDTTRVVLDLKTDVNLNTKLSSDGLAFTVTLTKKSSGEINSGNEQIQNGNEESINGIQISPYLYYIKGNRPSLNLIGIDKSQIKLTDDYRSRNLILDLGGDYSSLFPSQTYKPNDGAVASMTITNNGTTKIILATETIYACEMKTNNGNTEISLVKPKEKYDKIIVLDIGHGGSDSGAVGNGLMEKAINYNQGMALYRLLEADPNIKVYMTRESDVYPTLQFRSALANEINADLFISIHNNSASASITGTETLYFPNDADPRGRMIAKLVQDNIVNDCGMVSRGIKTRSDLYVLRTTNMPAILIETGFVSNAAESARINSQSFINTWSQSVYRAIIEGFKIL